LGRNSQPIVIGSFVHRYKSVMLLKIKFGELYELTISKVPLINFILLGPRFGELRMNFRFWVTCFDHLQIKLTDGLKFQC